jgi:hypothetical protein
MSDQPSPPADAPEPPGELWALWDSQMGAWLCFGSQQVTTFATEQKAVAAIDPRLGDIRAALYAVSPARLAAAEADNAALRAERDRAVAERDSLDLVADKNWEYSEAWKAEAGRLSAECDAAIALAETRRDEADHERLGRRDAERVLVQAKAAIAPHQAEDDAPNWDGSIVGVPTVAKQVLGRMAAERDAALRRMAELEAVVRAVEWGSFGFDRYGQAASHCPACGGIKPGLDDPCRSGHEPDCPLAIALAGAGEEG